MFWGKYGERSDFIPLAIGKTEVRSPIALELLQGYACAVLRVIVLVGFVLASVGRGGARQRLRTAGPGDPVRCTGWVACICRVAAAHVSVQVHQALPRDWRPGKVPGAVLGRRFNEGR